jgi:protein TonB
MPPGPAVSVAPSRDTESTGSITRYARPRGGYQVQPGYPDGARRLGIQGTSLLKVHVLIDGRVGDIVIEKSAGHPDLDQAAADAVRRWRFEPGRRGDDAIAMWVLLPVEFRLK